MGDGMMGEKPRKRERSTSEVAQALDVRPDLLRKWKARGFLPSAPQGVSGQGRGVECFWSDEAVEEARRVMETRKPTKLRMRGYRDDR